MKKLFSNIIRNYSSYSRTYDSPNKKFCLPLENLWQGGKGLGRKSRFLQDVIFERPLIYPNTESFLIDLIYFKNKNSLRCDLLSQGKRDLHLKVETLLLKFSSESARQSNKHKGGMFNFNLLNLVF